MEDRRSETLEALSAYIDTQRTLLARTQADIERLRQLRSEAASRPKEFAENIGKELNDRAFRLSDQNDCFPSIPQKLDWEIFASRDASALKIFTTATRLAHSQRNTHHVTQRSPLSNLQKFVKEAQKAIIDPVFQSINNSASTNTSEPPTPSVASRMNLPIDEDEEAVDEQPTPKAIKAERKRERERAKIRELKMKIGCGLTVSYGLEKEGVFVRMGIGDESDEIDIGADVVQGKFEQDADMTGLKVSPFLPMEVDSPLDSSSSSVSIPSIQTPGPPSSQWPKSPRIRKTTAKVRCRDTLSQSDTDISSRANSRNNHPRWTERPGPLSSLKAESLTDLKILSRSPEQQSLGKRTRGDRKGDVIQDLVKENKPKSGTYKMAWSVSEQHLLERLLQEIPEGEKNRWQKISQAMSGRRTPRQVASRVQKYFEKLKRFGVGTAERERSADSADGHP